jgi:hypothetical protein
MNDRVTVRRRFPALLAAVSIGLTLAACSAFPLPSPPDPTKALFDACETVQLPKVDATTFDESAPDCVIVLWDAQMKEAVLTGGMRLLPPELKTAAGAAGYTDTCEVATNAREIWLKHLPTVDTTVPVSEAWIATTWTRGAAQDQADALCRLISSYLG